MQVNHEALVRMYGEARRQAGAVDRHIEQWAAIVSEFIRQQDAALRDTRDALREAMARAATDQAEIARLRAENEKLLEGVGPWSPPLAR